MAHPGAGMSLESQGLFAIALDTSTLWTSKPLGRQNCDTVGPDPAGDNISRWNPVTRCVLSTLGQSIGSAPAGNLADVNIIILYESSGDQFAINKWDRNFLAGHPSEGLVQVIRPTFDQFRSMELANDLYDPAANLYAGLNYAVNTYGSIHNVPGLVSLRAHGPYVGFHVKG